jgi:hypothetical protein
VSLLFVKLLSKRRNTFSYKNTVKEDMSIQNSANHLTTHALLDGASGVDFTLSKESLELQKTILDSSRSLIERLVAYSEIANEIYDVLRDAPGAVAIPVSNGTLLAGIYIWTVKLLFTVKGH